MLSSERDRVFSEWLERYKGVMFRIIHAHAGGHADRQDLFQEIALQLWRSVDAFRGESSAVTWIYRVALNTAVDWTRRETRHRRGRAPLDAVEGLITPSSAGSDPRLDWLYRQIRALNEVDRSLALLMLDGLSYREMADVLGISANYVGVKINRIKELLIERETRGGNES